MCDTPECFLWSPGAREKWLAETKQRYGVPPDATEGELIDAIIRKSYPEFPSADKT